MTTRHELLHELCYSFANCSLSYPLQVLLKLFCSSAKYVKKLQSQPLGSDIVPEALLFMKMEL